LVLGNWPLKLAAIALASVLYAGVALSDNTRSWASPVPIEVLRAPAGGALLELPGAVTEITYRAPLDVANQLTAGSFRASIDLSMVQPRVGAEPVEVPVDVFPIDPRVRVVDYTPRGVNVRLDEVVTRGMPVSIDTGTVPEGIELGPIIAEPNQVFVRGASSRVSNVRSVEGHIGIDGSAINIDQDVPIEVFDELGALVPGVDLDPPSVRVRVDVARRLAYATLPVVPELRGDPADGYRIETVTVSPSVVTVSGEDPAVRQLESIATGPVDVSDQEKELVIEVPFVLPEEVTVPGDPMATVTIIFAPVEGSRSLEVGTVLVGTRSDRSYRVEDASVQVVAAGPVAALDGIDLSELIVEVPVAGLEVGEHAIVPQVRLPDGLQVARIDPEVVRVTVGQPT
jgi:YbbR domain-containing protein